ncbi:MAG: hypothetical protein HND48_16235 [Chloroflexi bacterium]|nr:hypothetical protein [Chloroflexota bacterium]
MLTPHIGGMVQFNRLSGGEFPVVAEPARVHVACVVFGQPRHGGGW